MSTFEEGKKQIVAYDVYGVQIANRLLADYANPETKETTEKKVREVLIPGFLDPVNEMVKNGNFAMAMYTYFQMISTLSQSYNINYVVPTEGQELELEPEGYTRKLTVENA